MPEEYSIEIETTGGYQTKKKYNAIVKMTSREFLALVEKVLDYTDDLPEQTA